MNKQPLKPLTDNEIKEILREEYPDLFEQDIERLAKTCADEKWFLTVRRNRLGADLRATSETPSETEEDDEFHGERTTVRASCPPSFPKDSPEAMFRDSMLSVPKPFNLLVFAAQIDTYCVELFKAFWREWSQIEEVPNHTSGEEGAIALLQTMTGSKTRETALTAYCYLLAIGRTPLSQVDVARLFWGEEEGDKHRATVNARVMAIRDDLGLRKVRGMKRDEARESYATRASKIHDQRKEQTNTLWKNPVPSLASQAKSLKAA